MKNLFCILTIFILNINFVKAQGHLVFKQKEIVLDSVDKDKIRATFYFTNTGSYDIKIKSVTASFDWCVPNYNCNEILQPGQSDSIWISCITSYNHQQGNFLVTTEKNWDGMNNLETSHGGWNSEEYHLKISYSKTVNSTAKEISITKATTLKTICSKGDTIGICVTGTIQGVRFWPLEDEVFEFNIVWKNTQGGYDTLWDPRAGFIITDNMASPQTITVKDKIVFAWRFWEWFDLRKLPYGEYKILLIDGNGEYKATNSFVITQ